MTSSRSPSFLLHDLAANEALCAVMSGRRTARACIERGREIPDHLLPGRAIQRLPAHQRATLAQLLSDQAANVAPWWIQVICS